MHSDAIHVLGRRRAEVLARSGGRCEACHAVLGPDVRWWSAIDGLPEPAHMLALCVACWPSISAALSALASLPDVEARLAAFRATR